MEGRTHGEIRDHRMETQILSEHVAVTETVCQQWCTHCQAWVEVRGVSGRTGAIGWMLHDGQTPGICPQGAAS